ncbi:MAG: hypothetical protein O4803_04800 [Trichodesmium sp. St15_bin1_1]|nr:hypothetical protein [Trichodesmium sp. St5_bin2_1]MDE5082367.1 hypothetical protein [Trichodesmium sp. St18_bin1]MDE5108799.1 hypothetical protein [Trichodesmium sp. St17_bin3_1_1]MDE5113602.1 hypothetical protein [Trichodesmium sp. St15_bin1_1]MDE5123041.1 hypothetical protein [Trichodesmium sp. St19_bin1]
MSYSDFTLVKVKQTFEIKTTEKKNHFANLPPLEPSSLLIETLSYNVAIALASNSEKARSEMIIAPILIDIKRQNQEQINIFSGIDFTVEPEKGLNGICDFLITKSPEMLTITAPVITIVEAKKENLNLGLGQCIAEMIAARIFNQKEGNNISTIYGVITSGTNWRFLKLEGENIIIDLTEYYLNQINLIMGILTASLTYQAK